MNLFSGMEKFGFSMEGELDILADESGKKDDKDSNSSATPVVKTEKDFVLDKKTTCPICNKTFMYRSVLATKIKRLEPDFDLRPNYEYIDKLKYDFISCPGCGFSALDSTFGKIDSARMKLIRNEFCPSFRPEPRFVLPEIYTYDYAIEKYKLALICSIKKRAKLSEKAYVCLKIAWLRRAQLKEAENDPNIKPELKAQYKAEYDGFYKQAYEGFMKAISTETPPFCGMASEAVEYMLANMSFYYKQYEDAGKLVARLIQAPSTSRKLKDKCVDLKQEIVEAMAAQKNS